MIFRNTVWLKLAYLIAVFGILFLVLSDYGYDDPYITFRYAQNISSGLGFVYNLDERVLSTTTPLFAILLALLTKISLPIEVIANAVSALSIAVGALFFWEIAQSWKTPWVGWTGLLLYPTFPLLLSTTGSEIPLFLALILGGFLLYTWQHYGGTALLLTLAILTRSDGMLAALLLGMHYIWVNRRELRNPFFWRKQPWFWIAISGFLLIVWHGFAWFYFGSPLPVTLAVKQAQGRMEISQHFAPGALSIAGWYADRWQYWLELLLVGIGLIYGFLKKQQWLLMLSWTAIYFMAYTILGVTRYFWYYAPLVPGWIVAVGLGLTFLNDIPLIERTKSLLKLEKIRRVFLILLLTTLFSTQFLQVSKMRYTNDTRYKIYRAVGEWLAENTAEDAAVGALEVGMIGFYSHRSMVDFAGLLQPEVAHQMKRDTTYDDTAVWATMIYRPQYLALIDGAHSQLEAKVVDEFCQPVKRFLGSQYDYRDMQIYFCQYD